MPQRWFEVTVNVPTDCGDAVANFLIEQGAPGIQSEELSGQTVLVAHFPQTPPLRELRRFYRALRKHAMERTGGKIRVRQIREEDWAENWKLHFRQECVGQRLVICPSWNSQPPAGRVAVIIDPGMAFGTGQHPTTRGCLELLDSATQTRRVHRALDVGTGSGVLAIALAKLGLTDVWGLDNDPIARAVAAANAARNGVSERIRIVSSLG